MAPERRLTGVNGWLLAFCIVMTIIRPLFILHSIVNGPRRHALWVTLDVVKMPFGVAIGISLWKVNADAIRLLRFYFGLTLALMLIVIGYRLSVGGPYSSIGIFIPIAIWGVLFPLVRTSAEHLRDESVTRRVLPAQLRGNHL